MYVASLKEGKKRNKNYLSKIPFITPFRFLNPTIRVAEFSKGMILPKKDTPKENVTNIKSGFNIKEIMNTTVLAKNDKTGYKIATTTVKQQQKFQCRAQEFYNVITTIEVKISFAIIVIKNNNTISINHLRQRPPLEGRHSPVFAKRFWKGNK